MEIIQPLMAYLSPLLAWAVGIVVAAMNVLKKWDKEDKYRRYYWLFGLGMSAVASVVITLIMGFNWPLLLVHFVVLYITQAGTDLAVWKPFIKEIVPLIAQLLSKTKRKKIE